jgi:hypothetical protein
MIEEVSKPAGRASVPLMTTLWRSSPLEGNIGHWPGMKSNEKAVPSSREAFWYPLL